jgi:RNA polymerase sigma-70 factor, ECF subfamily
MTLEPAVREPMLAAIPNLRAVALALCRNREQAEDLVQGSLLLACANIASFTPGTSMNAWLCTILRNHFYSEYRRERRASRKLDGLPKTQATNPQQIASLEYRELWAALAKLDPKQREALMLVGASGLSYGEAAGLCGCPVGTIKSRVNRARTRLAEQLSIDSADDFGPDRMTRAILSAGGRG